MNLKLLLWIICISVHAVNGQCYSGVQTSTTTKAKYWEQDEINLRELFESLLDFIRLTREQIWIVDGELIISQSRDVSCALLSEGINIDELDIKLTQNWDLPVMTSAMVIGDKILVSSKAKSTLVTKVQFTHLAQLLK